jgi:hypothetical protein
MAEPVIAASNLRWATVTAGGPEVVNPDNTHKDNGWTSAEEPPHTFFNYWMNVVYLWLVYLDGLPAEAMTWTAAHIFQAGITVTSAGTSVTATGASGQFYGARGIATGNGAAGNPNAGLKGEAAAGTNSSGVRGDASGAATRFAGWFKAATGAVPLHTEGGKSDFNGARSGTSAEFFGGEGTDIGGGQEDPGGIGIRVFGGSSAGSGGGSPGGIGGYFQGGDGDDGGDAIVAVGGSGGFNSGAGGRFTGGVTDSEGHGVIATGGASAHPGSSSGGYGLLVEGGLSDTGVWADAIHSTHGDWSNASGNLILSAGNATVSGVGTFGSIFAEAPIAITLANSWANVGGAAQVAQYWKDKTGYVHVRGLVSAASAGNGTLFTLPVGYRPAATQYFDVFEGTNSTMNRITVSTAGAIAYAGSLGLGGSNISINAITFRV